MNVFWAPADLLPLFQAMTGTSLQPIPLRKTSTVAIERAIVNPVHSSFHPDKAAQASHPVPVTPGYEGQPLLPHAQLRIAKSNGFRVGTVQFVL